MNSYTSYTFNFIREWNVIKKLKLAAKNLQKSKMEIKDFHAVTFVFNLIKLKFLNKELGCIVLYIQVLNEMKLKIKLNNVLK